jgi:hypothetical protein
MATTERPRPRLGPGLIVLLVVISIANLLALAIIATALYDEVDHGGEVTGVAVLSLLTAVAALAGIAGAWARATWGPPLYFAAQATGFLVVLFAAPDAIGLLSFVPLLLAGLLWFLAG